MRALGRLAIGIAIAVVAATAALAVAAAIGITVDLSRFRPEIERAASRALARTVRVEGTLELLASTSPTLEVGGLLVSSPDTAGGRDFVSFELARLGIRLWPLLRRDFVIHELRAERVRLDLVRDADGRVNWELGGRAETDAETNTETETEATPGPARPRLIRSLEVEEIALHAVEIRYEDTTDGTRHALDVDALGGTVATHEPLRLAASGRLGALPWQASLEGDAPAALLDDDEEPWPLRLALEIAETSFELSTRIDVPLTTSARAKAESGVPLLPPGSTLGEIAFSISGARLDRLDPLLGVALPAWGPHRMRGALRLVAGRRAESDLVAEVGASRLEGRATLDASATPPRVDVTFEAPEIQLDDFALGAWRPVVRDADQAPPPDTPPRAAEGAAPPAAAEALLSPESLRRLDGSLALRVASVRAGTDALGAGEAVARLEGGRFELDPVHVEGPGGNVTLSLAYEPRELEQESTLRVLLERFDYGVLARRVQPDAALGGLFSLDLEARSRGPLGAPPLAHADGHLDVAIFPEDLPAGVIDLWTVNLLLALLPVVDPVAGSRIECGIGLFDLESGVLRERALLLDTTNMTVRGRATVDFRERTLEAHLRPRAKKPRLLSLATPVHVRGTFDDFGVGLTGRGLLETAARIVTSPVHVPVRRLLSRLKRPLDADACLEAMAEAKRGGGR